MRSYAIIVNDKMIFGGKSWIYYDFLRYAEKNNISSNCITII